MKTKEQKIAELKAEIERLEKEAGSVWARFEPECGEAYFLPDFSCEDNIYSYEFCDDGIDGRAITNGVAFKTKEQAAAVADAMIVMCQLRRCKGAGQRSDDGVGFVYQLSEDSFMYDFWGRMAFNTICPQFPTKELCKAAIEKVGRDRVEAAIKLWAMVDA